MIPIDPLAGAPSRPLHLKRFEAGSTPREAVELFRPPASSRCEHPIVADAAIGEALS
jgi:hypothetical protein